MRPSAESAAHALQAASALARKRSLDPMVVDIIFAVLGVGGTLFFIGYLIHLAIAGAPERDREAAAREHLRRTGRWPDEQADEASEAATVRSTRTGVKAEQMPDEAERSVRPPTAAQRSGDGA